MGEQDGRLSGRDERLLPQGLRGPQGNQGNMGNQGNPGRQGGPGSQGERGARGEPGVQGERGIPGLSRAVRRALVYMFVLFLLLVAANFLWSARQQNAYEASLAREHAAHLKADELMVDKLCLTFGKLGALKPPAGNPAKNPSRAFEQEEHATLVELGADLGCKPT